MLTPKQKRKIKNAISIIIGMLGFIALGIDWVSLIESIF